MLKQVKLLSFSNIYAWLCLMLLVLLSSNVSMARRARKRPIRKPIFDKRAYDNIVLKMLEEKQYEDYASAWTRFLIELDTNITEQIFHPSKKGGEKLCNDVHFFNQELETVLIPLKQENPAIVYVARKLFARNGPQYILEFLPENDKLRTVFDWNDYQLSRFYRLWMETRMIWEDFKEAYLTMKVKCHYLHKL